MIFFIRELCSSNTYNFLFKKVRLQFIVVTMVVNYLPIKEIFLFFSIFLFLVYFFSVRYIRYENMIHIVILKSDFSVA